MAANHKDTRGAGNGRARLSENDVRAIKRMLTEDGLCRKCIARMFDVKYATVAHIAAGRSWRHIT